ncbi:putative non-specific serine/threonine protein kinase [Helianthus annuus]|nr:putative non-specific serine/threonine protein kinase [Helianthus annuus]
MRRTEHYEEGCHLSWSRRMNIMIGVAKGLRYLHMEIEPPIYYIQAKLKCSGILRKIFHQSLLTLKVGNVCDEIRK